MAQEKISECAKYMEELSRLTENLMKIAKRKGFAVVASEFRKLADNTSKLSKEIKNIVEQLSETLRGEEEDVS